MIHFAALLVALIALRFMSDVAIYLILSIFLTILFMPLMRFFERRGLPSIIGYGVSLALFVLLFGVLFNIVLFSAKQFIANFSGYHAKFLHIFDQFNALLARFDLSVDTSVLKEFDFIAALKGFVAKAGSIVKGFLIVFIGVSFLLFESRYIEQKLGLLGKKEQIEAFLAGSQKYFLIKTFTSFLTGLFVALMLLFFGVPYALFFGILAFLFNFIPVVGSIIAAIPGIFVILVTYDIATALYVTALYIIINITISNVLEPKLMGDGLGISPAVVFFSLILWSWVFGIVGAFLAVPLTNTVQVALSSSPQTRKWALLLSNYKGEDAKRGV